MAARATRTTDAAFNFKYSTAGLVERNGRSPTNFGYDAIEDTKRRKIASPILQSEDAELNSSQRRQLVASARDIHRNYGVAGWMMRKDCDYVSTFEFQSKIGDKAKDRQVEDWFREWSKAANCDVAGRHSFQRMIRLARGRVLVDGDVGIIRLRDGRLQACEGDRIRSPTEGSFLEKANPNARELLADLENVTHGVRTNRAGKALAYYVHNRGRASDFMGMPQTFFFDRVVGAQNLYLYGNFDRFDQIRGVSLYASVLNDLRDIYEGKTYALAKMKVSQLFAFAVMRGGDAPMAPTEATDSSAADPRNWKYKIDFGRGPAYMEFDPNDKPEFLETSSPSSEFQSFMATVIAVCLKAFDIPYSFFAEDFTNYSGARQAMLQYEQACEVKRRDVVELLDWIISWRLALAVIDGELPGISLEELNWLWIPSAMPWIDPLKEFNADAGSVEQGFESTIEVIKRRTGRDHIDVLAEEAQYEKDREAFGLAPRVGSAKAIAMQMERQQREMDAQEDDAEDDDDEDDDA